MPKRSVLKCSLSIPFLPVRSYLAGIIQADVIYNLYDTHLHIFISDLFIELHTFIYSAFPPRRLKHIENKMSNTEQICFKSQWPEFRATLSSQFSKPPSLWESLALPLFSHSHLVCVQVFKVYPESDHFTATTSSYLEYLPTELPAPTICPSTGGQHWLFLEDVSFNALNLLRSLSWLWLSGSLTLTLSLSVPKVLQRPPSHYI